MNSTNRRDQALTPGVRQFVADDLLSVVVVPSSDGASVTVAPAGEVDFVTASALRSALFSVLQPPCTRAIVNLDEVTFLNSAGLTVLAEAHHRGRADGIIVGVQGGGKEVLRPLRLTGLWDLLAIPPDE